MLKLNDSLLRNFLHILHWFSMDVEKEVSSCGCSEVNYCLLAP